MANVRQKKRNIRPGVGRGRFSSSAPQPLVKFRKESKIDICVENVIVSVDLTKNKETLYNILQNGIAKTSTASQLNFLMCKLKSKSAPVE